MNGSSQALSKSRYVFNEIRSLLQQQATTRSLRRTKQLHAYTISSGLLVSDQSNHLGSNLACSYAMCGDSDHALKLFDELAERSLFLWNSMMRMYSHKGLSKDVVYLFVEMLNSGQCRPDGFTFPYVLKACSDLSFLNMGMSIHGQTLMGGFESNTFVQNSLLAMYMGCGHEELARRVFDEIRERTVVSWNTMISGYFRNGCAEEALMVFNRMLDVGVEPDASTVVSVLPVCGYLKDLSLGRWVHELAEEEGFGSCITVRNSLVDMYAKCGSIDEARLVFDKMDKRDVVSWSALIGGYVLNGKAREALVLCHWMHMDGVRPNYVTVAALLTACVSLCSLRYGECLHGWVIRCGLESDVVMETALIDMYGKCNRVNLSFLVFTKTSKGRTVQWNAVISGHVHNGLAREAIELFKQMRMEVVDPDGTTLISLLPAYAMIADLQQARNVHGYLIRSGFHSRIQIATGLIDIYSKCGSLEDSYELFNRIPEKDKDIVAWSAIISAYGAHGHGKAAIALFHQMVQSGVNPNEVTFTSLLQACSHTGLVDEGVRLFKSIIEDHQVKPGANHYTCIVDLLGRAGRLQEAYELIKSVPFKSHQTAWGALLGACVIHENVQLGVVAANHLFELEPENTGNYILLSKIYSAAGRWEDAENVRFMMNEMGLRKSPGHSFVEVTNVVNTDSSLVSNI